MSRVERLLSGDFDVALITGRLTTGRFCFPAAPKMHLKERIIGILEVSAVHTYERNRSTRYTFALLAILLINLLRLPLIPWIGNPLPTLFVSPAIMVVTWFCGLGPGLFAVGLSFLSVSVLWMEPHFSLDLTMDQDWLAMLLFAGTTIFLALFTEMARNALASQKKMRDQLETMVAERTAHLQETIGDLQAFSYTVSHDLRSPLRAMQGFASIVAEENEGKLDSTSQAYLRRISSAASRLDGLISDLLAFSKIGLQQIALQSVDLEQLLPDILEQYPSIQRNDAEITIQHPLLRVMAHPPYLTQALANLLDNAAKFVRVGTRPRIVIWAETRNEGANVRLCIRDNGIGIQEDQLGKIFEVFQRIDTATEGTGIGLSIVKKAVEKMGGQIGVDSTVGQGSTFWIELPAESSKLGHQPGVLLRGGDTAAGTP
jgi:signal transduction histidine kinase